MNVIPSPWPNRTRDAAWAALPWTCGLMLGLTAVWVGFPSFAGGQESKLVSLDAAPATTIPTATVPATTASPSSDPKTAVQDEPMPFDFDPYRVMIWVVSDSPQVNADILRDDLLDHLDRDFASIWRTTIGDAPASVSTAAMRDMGRMDFDVIAAADTVLAVKMSLEDAVRMKFASDVGRYVGRIDTTKARMDEVRARLISQDDEGLAPAWLDKLQAVPGDALDVQQLWNDPTTEAVMVSRGMAEEFGKTFLPGKKEKSPSAKIITPPLEGQVSDALDQFDKVIIVNVRTRTFPMTVQAVELDTLMRHFGTLASVPMSSTDLIIELAGEALRQAFRPVVRVDDAGAKNATGLIRAAGLILDENSPGLIRVGDVLEPMIRKNDRNGNPISIGPLDWAYLNTKEKTGNTVKMDFYSGRIGGLQGRSNNRTFRMGLKVNPTGDQTMIRLHAQKEPDQPLIGYEIYDKELDSTSMTFVGRTDWNGRLVVKPIDRPLRLLYVKNGGAVLARLPLVPGHHSVAVADLAGDDMRLQAESYIRGVQNSIIDLVALRELFKARIMMRLQRGQDGDLQNAEELLEGLRQQPSNEALANEMGKRQTIFLKAIGRNPNQSRKVDNMFSQTREMLTKHINPKLIRDLEEAYVTAKGNGGKLPASFKAP